MEIGENLAMFSDASHMIIYIYISMCFYICIYIYNSYNINI